MTATKTKPLRGEARLTLAKELKARYRAGATIQELADETGRSTVNISELLYLARTRLRRPVSPVKKPRKARVVVKKVVFREPGTPAVPAGPLNKTRLAEAVAADLGITIPDAFRAIDATLGAIVRTNAAGHDVTITNFGTFRAVTDPARIARNPQTGRTVEVPARPTVRFRVAPRLAEIIRSGDASASLKKHPSN